MKRSFVEVIDIFKKIILYLDDFSNYNISLNFENQTKLTLEDITFLYFTFFMEDGFSNEIFDNSDLSIKEILSEIFSPFFISGFKSNRASFKKFKNNLDYIDIQRFDFELILVSLEDLLEDFEVKINLEITRIDKKMKDIFLEKKWDYKEHLENLEKYYDEGKYYKCLEEYRIFREGLYLNLYGVSKKDIPKFKPFDKFNSIDLSNVELKDMVSTSHDVLLKINGFRNLIKQGSEDKEGKYEFSALSEKEQKILIRTELDLAKLLINLANIE